MKTTSKFASVMSVWAMFLCITALSTTVHAANTFEDPMGRFVIDLPEGWKLEPQTDQTVYVFKGTLNSNSIIVEYLENSKSAASAFNSGINSLKGAGLPNASAVGEVTDLSVNANPARWGVYSDELTYGSVKVLLYGLLGAVSLEKGGVYFLSIVNKDDRDKFQQPYKTAFQSIRTKDQLLTGASNETVAIQQAEAPSSSTFTHPSITLTLPHGWAANDIPANFEKETVAWLQSQNIPGASIIVLCYRGPLQSYRSTRIRGLKTIAAAYPQGQTEMKKASKLATESGFAATTELWRGFVASGSQTLTLQSPMGIVKSDKGWILMIGYVPDANGPQMEEDFSKILRSAK